MKLTQAQLAIYSVVIKLMQMLQISPKEAIPVLRAVADDAQFIIDRRAEGMSYPDATEKLNQLRSSQGHDTESKSNPIEVAELEAMLNLKSIN
jgi:hypothetical protein